MTRLDKNLIPADVLTANLKVLGSPETDKAYNVIAKLSPYTVFDNWLRYQGIVGFTEDIIKAYEGIKAAQITKP